MSVFNLFFSCYVRFLASSKMEWTDGEKQELYDLAKMFGPPELELLFKTTREQEEPLSADNNQINSVIAALSREITAKESEESTEKCVGDCSNEYSSSKGVTCRSQSNPNVAEEDSASKGAPSTAPSAHNKSEESVIFLDDSLKSNGVAEDKALLDECELKNGSDIVRKQLAKENNCSFFCEKKFSVASNLKAQFCEQTASMRSPDIFDVASDDSSDERSSNDALSSIVENVFNIANLSAGTAACVPAEKSTGVFHRGSIGDMELGAGDGEAAYVCESHCESSPRKIAVNKSGAQNQFFEGYGGILSPINRERSASCESESHYLEEEMNFEGAEAFSFLNDTECSGSLSELNQQQATTSELGPKSAFCKKRKKSRIEDHCTSTPVAEGGIIAKRLKELGSNVKIVKTSNITPLPQYEVMTDVELKVFFVLVLVFVDTHR